MFLPALFAFFGIPVSVNVTLICTSPIGHFEYRATLTAKEVPGTYLSSCRRKVDGGYYQDYIVGHIDVFRSPQRRYELRLEIEHDCGGTKKVMRQTLSPRCVLSLSDQSDEFNPCDYPNVIVSLDH